MAARTNGSIIELRDVVKVYPTAAGGFTALADVALDIQRGEFVGVIGKSGAGKTTLLNMISGVDEITSGEVLFYPQASAGRAENRVATAVHAMREDQLAAWRGRNLGIIFQSFELMPQLDLVNNVMLPQDFCGAYRPRVSRQRALESLETVELTEHVLKQPAQLSGGQQQRVAIARALINDPPVILADEPTGKLDTVTAEIILRIFEKLVEQGKTIIMVTHDASLAPRFSRYLRIADGRIVGDAADGEAKGASAQAGVPVTWAVAGLPSQDSGLLGARTTVGPAQSPSRVPKGGRPEVATRDADIPAVLLRDVTKTYRSAAGEFTALRGMSLKVRSGQFVSIVGKSGCGKSTLLNMITGIDHPTSGDVLVGGKPLYQMSESQRAMWRGRNVGIVFQFFQLLPTLTLLENVMLPMDYCNVFPVRQRRGRAVALLEMVGLEDQAHKLPGSVSIGQQQGAAVARALATDPPIIVADEPTGNLDSLSARRILHLFATLAAQGKTILIVTHDPSITGQTDRTVILSNGELIDSTVALALPFLDHPRMLKVTKQIRNKVYSPGSTIVHQGEPAKLFYMIVGGQVDLVLDDGVRHEVAVGHLGPGQCFGQVELMEGIESIASVRCTVEGPVTLACLEKEPFLALLSESPRAKAALQQAAAVLSTENGRHQNGWRQR